VNASMRTCMRASRWVCQALMVLSIYTTLRCACIQVYAVTCVYLVMHTVMLYMVHIAYTVYRVQDCICGYTVYRHVAVCMGILAVANYRRVCMRLYRHTCRVYRVSCVDRTCDYTVYRSVDR